MKKATLLNAPLSGVIARLGHTDGLVIADAGLPIPPITERIDLAVSKGLPAFLDVLDAVLSEMEVERVLIAREMTEVSPALHAALTERLGERVPVEIVPHDTFKTRTAAAYAVVRTGEFTPYANVILYSGVVF